MPALSEQEIAEVEHGAPETLRDLDARGFFLGAGETCAAFADRLRVFCRNLEELDHALQQDETIDMEGMPLSADARIPAEHFAEAGDITERLFCFNIDWVPGFFINPRFSWLFGGCAFYSLQDFFALFIIRKSFAKRAKWLFYRRRELLAHELCHVARIGIGSNIFEETFAYRTAESRFRRTIGGIFRRPLDAYLLLGSTLLLLCAQVLNVLVIPAVPVMPFFGIVGATVLFLGLRHWHYQRRLKNALNRLKALTPEHTWAVAFRCTDDELLSIGRITDTDALRRWVHDREDSEPRWRVIVNRFLSAADTT